MSQLLFWGGPLHRERLPDTKGNWSYDETRLLIYTNDEKPQKDVITAVRNEYVAMLFQHCHQRLCPSCRSEANVLVHSELFPPSQTIVNEIASYLTSGFIVGDLVRRGEHYAVVTRLSIKEFNYFYQLDGRLGWYRPGELLFVSRPLETDEQAYADGQRTVSALRRGGLDVQTEARDGYTVICIGGVALNWITSKHGRLKVNEFISDAMGRLLLEHMKKEKLDGCHTGTDPRC
jgi:hypothetical protein